MPPALNSCNNENNPGANRRSRVVETSQASFLERRSSSSTATRHLLRALFRATCQKMCCRSQLIPFGLSPPCIGIFSHHENQFMLLRRRWESSLIIGSVATNRKTQPIMAASKNNDASVDTRSDTNIDATNKASANPYLFHLRLIKSVIPTISPTRDV